MQDYTFLRELAGSFGTVFLVVSFLGFVLFALRPGSRQIHADSAEIPFRHDDRPATDRPATDKPATDKPAANREANGPDGPVAGPKEPRP